MLDMPTKASEIEPTKLVKSDQEHWSASRQEWRGLEL